MEIRKTQDFAPKMVNKYKHVKVDATIHVDPHVTPVINPPRHIAHAIESEVKNELDCTLKIGVVAL